MRKSKNKSILVAAALLLSLITDCALAAIQTLGFDNLASGSPIPIGYGSSDNFGGFTGGNFLVTDATNPQLHPLSAVGFEHGVASPKNVVYNIGGSPASLSAASPFIFVGGQFTAWFDLADLGISGGEQTLTLQGYRNGALVFTDTRTLSPFSQLAFAGEPSAIDQLKFSGTLLIGGQDVGRPLQWMMDDFQYQLIPESQLVLQVGVGMLMLFAFAQWRAAKPKLHG